MTEERYRLINALWQIASSSSNGSVEGLIWTVTIERNDHGSVIQLAASGQGCRMLVNPGEHHPLVVGAVDAFFSSNLETLLDLAAGI